MKAVVYAQYGSPDVLQLKDVEIPVPTANELLIKVHATTVNRTDCAHISAKPFIMRFFTGLFTPKRAIAGTTFAGKVVAVGDSVDAYQEGDDVFGMDDDGLSSFAEYLTVSADKAVARIPVNITYEQAAASMEGAHYAYNFINKVNLKSDHVVLVNGATGAIGSAAVQLLKYYGIEVVAVCNTRNTELVKLLGANRVIDYMKEDFTKLQHEYDFIFDAVGKSTFGKCKTLLKPDGVYISSDPGEWAQNILFALITPVLGRKIVKFPIPVDIKGSVLFIKKLMEQRHFMPVIDRQYPIERIAEAFRYVETGEKTGNVVISVEPHIDDG